MAFQVKAGGNWVNVTDPQVKVAGSWTPVKEVLVKDAGTWKSVWVREANVRGNDSPTDTNSPSSSTYGNTKDGSLGDTSTYDILDYLGKSNVTVSRVINFDSASTTSSTLYLKYGGESLNQGYTTATAYLKYSTDGGSTYTTIATITHTNGSTGPTSYSVALPANVNLSNVKVKYETHQTYTDVQNENCLIYGYGPPPDYDPYCTTYAYDTYYSKAKVKVYDCYINYS